MAAPKEVEATEDSSGLGSLAVRSTLLRSCLLLSQQAAPSAAHFNKSFRLRGQSGRPGRQGQQQHTERKNLKIICDYSFISP